MCGVSYGYMLNPDFHLTGIIENLAALDQEQDRLIVGGRNGEQYAISIYSPEELLAKAQPGVLY